MITSLLAKRFLLSKSSDGFLSLIAWVSMIGVALGVLALVVVTSVVNGFQSELQRVISGANGEVVLYTRSDPVSDIPVIERKIRQYVPQVEAVSASLITELMAGGPRGVAGILLEGIDTASFTQVTTAGQRVQAGRLPSASGEIALATVIASRLGLKAGDRIRLVVPRTRTEVGRGSSIPEVQEATVVGIVDLGLYEYNSKYSFGHRPWVQEIFGLEGKATTFKMKLQPGQSAPDAAAKLTEYFGYPFRAKDWSQLNKNLLYAIQLEKVVISIILMAIILVAAFNVVSTLMMMIHDKTQEIAILKAMGFRSSASFRLFVLVGMGIGTVGTLSGLIGGLIVNFVLRNTRMIELPADVYYIGYLPVTTNWSEIGLIVGSALVICLVATLYPALRVSTQSPMDGIRYE